jgi:N-acetylglucosaminyldiphosphoundecaprenol N-acetyl-beta-D-mannosaminyltransferase
MRRLGIEWLFRLYQEPGRMWRRYIIGNFEFIARVIARRRRGSKP